MISLTKCLGGYSAWRYFIMHTGVAALPARIIFLGFLGA
ncbi:hypothetical protein SpAn4DRAFT_2638 [Sporomusa ovata]|uniref:Uncharacterized protein n=1 Tax=Sporomusa ovata TaxID=2378 RepID=A0A0U1L152_9FIRM|nr:hypothetical protein SpAn4DRAFT_2638 [Sporomusa ovata]